MRLPEAFRSLRYPDFRVFFVAQTISQIATWRHWGAGGLAVLPAHGRSASLGPLAMHSCERDRDEGVDRVTLARGSDRLESARLVLRRIAPDDLPFFTRLHALPEVAEHLYPGGRPRSPEETAAWLQYTLASYDRLALGYLAVLRKENGALIGRCGLMDLVVESAAPEHGIRRGWFGREQAAAGVALTFETELGYTLDPSVWGQGFATEAARCVRDYARDVLRLSYTISAILPQNARSRRVAERSGARADGQMDVVGLAWDRYMWPLATGG
jgi:ribosomal-protein-alanine N-acetyltransferase